MQRGGKTGARHLVKLAFGTSAAAICCGLAAASAAGPADDNLTTITVTATRQERSLLDVPISITALGRSTLDRLDVSDIHDIIRMTPGVGYVEGNNSGTVIAIRGVSTRFGTATTGVYLDDIPLQIRYFGAGTSGETIYPMVFDLDRVEVLRGPQGTLFGSSSEGGNIRFVTAQPNLSDYSGHAKAEVGYVDSGAMSYQIGAAEGGPIIPGVLGFRISAYDQQDGGWIDRIPYPGNLTADTNVNWTNTAALTAALKWQPLNSVTITPSIFYQETHRGGNAEFWSFISNPSSGKFVTGQEVATPTDDTVVLSSLKASWLLGGAELISDTGYLVHTRRAISDFSLNLNEILSHTANGPIAISPTVFSNPQRSFTEEIRAQSTDQSARVNWVVGAFYQDLKQRGDEYVASPDLVVLTNYFLGGKTVKQALGSDLLPGGIAYEGLDYTQDKQIAGFAQVDVKLFWGLTATAGVRYTHSDFSHANFQNGPFNGGASGNYNYGAEDDVTPKYEISYKPDDDLLFYASAAKGFRAGGANTPVPVTTCAGDLAAYGLKNIPPEYNADSTWSYEVGSKGRALGSRLQWDASGYYIKWNDIQTSLVLQHCGFPFTSNFGIATSKGFDLALQGAVTDKLTLGLAIGYTDARFSKSIYTTGTVPLPFVHEGELLQTPPLQVMVQADYQFDQIREYLPYAHLDNVSNSGYRLRSPVDASYDPTNSSFPANNVTTARFGARFGRWDASLYAKNLLNSHAIVYYQDYNTTSPLVRENSLTPRVVGVTVLAKF